MRHHGLFIGVAGVLLYGCDTVGSEFAVNAAHRSFRAGMTLREVMTATEAASEDRRWWNLGAHECGSTPSDFSVSFSEPDGMYAVHRITRLPSLEIEDKKQLYTRPALLQLIAEPPLTGCRRFTAAYGNWYVVLVADESGKVKTISTPQFDG